MPPSTGDESVSAFPTGALDAGTATNVVPAATTARHLSISANI